MLEAFDMPTCYKLTQQLGKEFENSLYQLSLISQIKVLLYMLIKTDTVLVTKEI